MWSGFSNNWRAKWRAGSAKPDSPNVFSAKWCGRKDINLCTYSHFTALIRTRRLAYLRGMTPNQHISAHTGTHEATRLLAGYVAGWPWG